MDRVRKNGQGVRNILRFNWHFYVIAFLAISLLLLLSSFALSPIKYLIISLAMLITLVILLSLAISYWIYDASSLYRFSWLPDGSITGPFNIANIHAGFDETSRLVKNKFPHSSLVVLDFYDPAKHTEASIKRARRAHPEFPGTRSFQTDNIPLPDQSCDLILLILSAHEIRDNNERIIFLSGIRRCLKPNGIVIVTEHLRDLPNFLAFNIGFFHFHPKKVWLKNFAAAGLTVKKEEKITPFLSTFTLVKNGITS